jgi:hypothetical protein
VLVAVAAPVAAQPAPDRIAERRERIKQRIRALRAYTLTEQLSLDEQTAARLFPVLAKFDDEFDKLLMARIDLQRRLQSAADLKDPRAIDKLIDEALANQRALWDTEDKRLAQLRKILTPAQVARVLIVLPAMERKIQNQLRKAVQRQRQPGQPVDPFAKRGRAPVDDDDDLDDPSIDEIKPRKNAAPATRVPANKVCDPFTSVHGCK